MANPRVAVVIVNWNGLTDTRACLDSLAQVTDPDLSLIVVDNGSSDGSVEAIRGSYPEVTVIELGENRRYAGGNNAGIVYALDQGVDAVLLLNNDTTAHPKLITRLAEAMPNEGGITVPRIYFADPPDLIWGCGGEVNLLAGRCHMTGHGQPDGLRFETAGEAAYAIGAAMLVHRTVFETVGMLDTEFYHSGEDVDFSLRARAAGFPIQYVPGARVWHHVSVSTGGADSPASIFYVFRGLFLLRHKHLSMLAQAVSAPLFGAFLAWSVIRLALIARRPRSAWAVVQAGVAAWRGEWASGWE